MKFLIVHGSYGSPDGNWFPRLKEKLELLNQDVLVPRFPTDDWDEVTKRGEKKATKSQNLNNWLKAFKEVVLPWAKDEKVVIIGHSLGPLFILHALRKYELNVDAAIFVSPFLHIPRNKRFWQIDVANKTFYKHSFNFSDLKRQIHMSFVLSSDRDPYVPAEKAKEFAQKLGSSFIPVLGGQHLSSEFNQNEFPLVLELCKSRIELTLYQKYLAHLSEYHPTDVVKQGKDRALFLPSSELAKEGTFHFRNLNKTGFCTLPVKEIKYWRDEQGIYMDEARKAASKVPIARVYIFEKLQDMESKKVKKTMKDDVEAGMSVHYCLRSKINISDNKLDFGIWDESYVCTVLHEAKAVRFTLDSSRQRLKEAEKHKKEIMSEAKLF